MTTRSAASTYNTRRKQSVSTALAAATLEDSPRVSKRIKLENKQDVITPPASPGTKDAGTQGDDEIEDPVLAGIVDFMTRSNMPSMCSREISEGLLSEGKVTLAGTTPSTIVDATIKQHLKRCSISGSMSAVQKVNDPRYPRKTLYHLSAVDPFSEPRQVEHDITRTAEPATPETRKSVDAESTASGSDDEMDISETLSNDGEGPFATSVEERKRMSMSPSPEADFIANSGSTTTTLEEAKRSVQTPANSEPTSPRKEQMSQTVNISIPPSPFITPRHSDDEAEHEQTLKLAPIYSGTTTKAQTYHDDFTDFVVQSPEDVTLGELEDLLGF